jgi:hypothetical protein
MDPGRIGLQAFTIWVTSKIRPGPWGQGSGKEREKVLLSVNLKLTFYWI